VLVCQFPFKAGPDGITREHLAAVNLYEALFDFTDEPVVIINRSLDRLSRQRFCRDAAPASRPRELSLKVWREIHFHSASVQEASEESNRSGDWR
jgi:hypothetical protein